MYRNLKRPFGVCNRVVIPLSVAAFTLFIAARSCPGGETQLRQLQRAQADELAKTNGDLRAGFVSGAKVRYSTLLLLHTKLVEARLATCDKPSDRESVLREAIKRTKFYCTITKAMRKAEGKVSEFDYRLTKLTHLRWQELLAQARGQAKAVQTYQQARSDELMRIQDNKAQEYLELLARDRCLEAGLPFVSDTERKKLIEVGLENAQSAVVSAYQLWQAGRTTELPHARAVAKRLEWQIRRQANPELEKERLEVLRKAFALAAARFNDGHDDPFLLTFELATELARAELATAGNQKGRLSRLTELHKQVASLKVDPRNHCSESVRLAHALELELKMMLLQEENAKRE